MTTKKIILIVLTVVSLIPVILSLIGSINQPQVQSNLQLYQTNLVLQASEFSGENIREFEEIRDSVLGKNPYKAAFDQYKEARKLSQKNLAQLKNELQRTNEQSKIIKESESPINSLPLFSGSAEQEKLQQEINQQREEIDKLDIKMGLLEIAQGKEKQALEQWENVKLLSSLPSLKYTADVLSNLWSDQVLVLPNSELTIQE
ncbi:MAG: CPBP family intramembrane glutamate endopeptidase, partial [Crocosphaera sp.]